jgi:hypothetical protein
MDDAGTEIVGGSILIEDGAIVWVGDHPLPPEAGNDQLLPGSAGDIEVVDGRGVVAVRGLINSHILLYQTMTRRWAPGSGLFDWLRDPLSGVGRTRRGVSACRCDGWLVSPNSPSPAARGAPATMCSLAVPATCSGPRSTPRRRYAAAARVPWIAGRKPLRGRLPPDDIVEDRDAAGGREGAGPRC